MADVNYILGTSGDDQLNAGAGLNDITAGLGNDTINAADGLNTINYAPGDGVDSVSFALPRTYQYAGFLTEAINALADPSSFSKSNYSNHYFATANQSLIAALPYEISSTLSGMRQTWSGAAYVDGEVDPAAAQAAFTQLIDWINAPVGNVVQFGPGITLSDVSVQLGATTDLGSGQVTPVQFAVALNNEAGMVFGLAGTQAVAGDTSVPPAINMQFQFADGTTATLADLLARPGQGVIGTQIGTDGDDFLNGSLSDDTLIGGNGNDKLDGGAGSDQLFGGAGDDVISGGSGNDTIYGEDGNDVMAAGKDGGFMSGGAGDDVYCFNRGDGQVTIDNQDWDGSGVDTISFGKDIAPSDLVASVDPASGNLTLAIAGSSDAITIAWFDPWNQMAPKTDEVIDRVQFFDADGTTHVYDLASLVNAAFPDPSAADPAASVALVAPGSTKTSFSEVGQPYARSYALTGNLFPQEDQAPTAAGIGDQTVKQDQHFSYVVPFVDPEGAPLALSVSTPDGSALPSWLQFDAGTGEFSGTPSNSDVGTVALIVTATDPGGLSTSATFNLEVQNVNDAPTVANSIPNQNATQGVAFSYTVPADTFADIDKGDTLSYSAKLADGSALPSWLKFDATTRTLSGIPPSAAGSAPQWEIQVVATDMSGASASDVFTLIDPPPPVAPPPVIVPPVDPTGRTIRGTRHNDRLLGTSGNDTIIGDKGNDRLRGRGGNDVLLGGSGNDDLDGGSGNDYLQGGSGKDKLNGGHGVDLLQGGSGDDRLTDTSGNNLLDGGTGNDTLTDGTGNSMLIGGKGNDHLHLGGGYDIIAFNRGDGRDVISSGKGGTATLSLGGGIRYEDLSLRRSGNDLILETGNGNDRITFEKWYAGKKYQAVSKLQVVSEATPAGSTGDKIDVYDFTGLVSAYDAARKHHPGLSKWTLSDAQTQFHLGGSDSAALGGDLAYQYGVNGTLAGIAVNAAQGTLGASQFGKQVQTLDSQSNLKDGLVKLS